MLPKEVELAHDLRLPLQLIHTSARMLQLSLEDSTVDARRYVDVLLKSTQQLQALLDERLTPPARGLDVAAHIRELCARWQPQAEQLGVTLRWTGPRRLMANLDGQLLWRALMNLVTNALRCAPRGGLVRVSLRPAGDFLDIRVFNDGAGIPPERLPGLFDSAPGRNGHGYGLPIVRDLAHRLGGTISARNVPGGSEFSLRVPMARKRA